MKASHNTPSDMRLRGSAVVSEPIRIKNALFLERMMDRRTHRVGVPAFPSIETSVSLS
jgi:hypothetical protein